MAIYVGNTLVADVGGGGVNLSTSTATRYLVGSASTTGDTENLYTNSNCYMSNNNLYSNGNKVVTETDYLKLVGDHRATVNGYITLGRIKINWGTLSIGPNTKGSTNFASSFGGNPYTAVCTWDYDAVGGQENYAIYQLSSSTIYIVNGEGTTRLFRYIAIGPA